jgi:hypothetical protein
LNFRCDDKISSDVFINSLIEVEKRLVFNEYKQSKNKTKTNKIKDGICETNIEQNQEEPVESNLEA